MKQYDLNNTNSGWIIELAWKYKWALLISFLAGAVLVYLASLRLPDKYESTAVVYAAGYDPKHQMELKEGNTMLLMSFLESNDLRDSVISAFNLDQHYGIIGNSGKGRSEVYQQYASNVSYSRTINRAIEIKVRDRNPEFAAELANGIVDITNVIKQEVMRRSTATSLERIESEYRRKSAETDSLSSRLRRSGQLKISEGISDIDAQIKQNQATINENEGQLTAMRKEIQVFNLNDYLDHLGKMLAEAKADYSREKARLDALKHRSSVEDTTMINAKTRVMGLESQVAQLESDIQSVGSMTEKYNRLINSTETLRRNIDDLRTRRNHLLFSYGMDVNDPGIKALLEEYRAESGRLRELKTRYEEALAINAQQAPAAYLISRAVPEYQAAYPKRKLYALGGGILTFIFVFGLMLVIDQNKRRYS